MSTGMNNNSENSLLLLIFQNTAWANVGSAGGLQPSSTAGSFYIGLHTANPGQSGTSQQTSEAGYTSYARQAVARSSGGWTVTGSSPTTAENAGAINFPAATGGSETETYVSVGVAASGATEYLFFGTCTNVAVSSPIQPIIAINGLTVTLQ